MYEALLWMHILNRVQLRIQSPEVVIRYIKLPLVLELLLYLYWHHVRA